MKTNLKKAALIATGVMLSSGVFAQSNDLGSADYVQPFSPSSSFRTWSVGVNGGLLNPYTFFSGHNSDYKNPNSKIGYGAFIKDQFTHGWGLQANFLKGEVAGHGAADPGLGSYQTDLRWAADLAANFTFANISWRNQQNVIQTYLTAGVGYMQYRPGFTLANGTVIDIGHDIKSAYIPVGVGFKIQVAKGINIDLGYQVNFVDADNFDGYNLNGNNDKFGYAHAGLEFALGGKSKPQMAAHNPVSSMRHEYLMTEQKLQSEVDAQKTQNDQLRSDLDATKASLAATNANLAKFTADEDGDGVPDFFDKCPGTAAGTKVDGSGCPLAPAKVIITEEDRRVVNEAIKNLEFDFGKATIRAHSYPSLERVARLLTDKNFSLKLAGHTDNVGSNDANLMLSKDRAESVKSFLVSKGANPSRIEATGYGETQPIATNKTAKGRQMNRRVEFTLY
ncbi:OmpA family protein [Mucilaginibacter panaciglaebae]